MKKNTLVLISLVTALSFVLTSYGQTKREKEVAAEGELQNVFFA